MPSEATAERIVGASSFQRQDFAITLATPRVRRAVKIVVSAEKGGKRKGNRN